MGIIERIFCFIDYKGISVNEFSKSINVSNGYLAKQRISNANVGSHIIEKIVNMYPNISIEWLITGQGEMLRGGVESTAVLAPVPATKLPADSREGIPLIPLNAMAGFMTGEVQVLEYECERYVVPLFREAEFLIQVKGSSMIPKYNSGDLVACKRLSLNDLFFQWNKVYVLDTAQGPLVKRIKKGTDDEHVQVVSDNKAYDPFLLHRSQIYSVALVVGVIRLV
jgi:phage repressor protein C with HTH and peptisase S24 domain